MNNENFLKEVLQLQIKWEKLFNSKKMTKKAIIDLCRPFRDKYNLTDKQTLCIARNELSNQDLLNILNKVGGSDE